MSERRDKAGSSSDVLGLLLFAGGAFVMVLVVLSVWRPFPEDGGSGTTALARAVIATLGRVPAGFLAAVAGLLGARSFLGGNRQRLGPHLLGASGVTLGLAVLLGAIVAGAGGRIGAATGGALPPALGIVLGLAVLVGVVWGVWLHGIVPIPARVSLGRLLSRPGARDGADGVSAAEAEALVAAPRPETARRAGVGTQARPIPPASAPQPSPPRAGTEPLSQPDGTSATDPEPAAPSRRGPATPAAAPAEPAVRDLAGPLRADATGGGARGASPGAGVQPLPAAAGEVVAEPREGAAPGAPTRTGGLSGVPPLGLAGGAQALTRPPAPPRPIWETAGGEDPEGAADLTGSETSESEESAFPRSASNVWRPARFERSSGELDDDDAPAQVLAGSTGDEEPGGDDEEPDLLPAGAVQAPPVDELEDLDDLEDPDDAEEEDGEEDWEDSAELEEAGDEADDEEVEEESELAGAWGSDDPDEYEAEEEGEDEDEDEEASDASYASENEDEAEDEEVEDAAASSEPEPESERLPTLAAVEPESAEPEADLLELASAEPDPLVDPPLESLAAEPEPPELELEEEPLDAEPEPARPVAQAPGSPDAATPTAAAETPDDVDEELRRLLAEEDARVGATVVPELGTGTAPEPEPEPARSTARIQMDLFSEGEPPEASAAAAPAPVSGGQLPRTEPEPAHELAPTPPPSAARRKPAGVPAPPTAASGATAPGTTAPRGEAGSAALSPQLVIDAGCLFLDRGRVAVSMLQKSFDLDFEQSCALLDELQELGLVGPYLGGQRRDILLTREQWLEKVGQPTRAAD